MRLLSALAAILLAVAASGCVVVEEDLGPGEVTGDEPAIEFDEDAAQGEPAAEDDDLRVQLDVYEGPGGSTLAFVPVYIGEEGPFPFALDTGASNTVIDVELAEDLGLEETGDVQDVRGVTGTGEVQPVRLDDWRMGDIELGERVAGALPLGPAENGQFVGLIGSDVLSEYGAVLVDYEGAELVLSPRS